MNSLHRILVLIFFNIVIAVTVVLSTTNNRIISNQDNGVEVWRTKNCTACHSIYGLGGHIGPDLTNVYAKGGEEYIDYVLKNGLGNMPDLNLTKVERKKLIIYLKYINGFGEYPLKNFVNNPFGKNNAN